MSHTGHRSEWGHRGSFLLLLRPLPFDLTESCVRANAGSPHCPSNLEPWLSATPREEEGEDGVAATFTHLMGFIGLSATQK